MSRRFDRSELAFFAVPRTWREIEMRFGLEAKTEDFRNCIILADNEGGAGLLKYLHPLRHRLSSGCEEGCWVLTDAGKHQVGERLIARELRVYPDERARQEEREAAGEAFNEALSNPFADLLVLPGPLEAERSALQRSFDALGGGTPCEDCGLPLAMGCDCARR